MTWEVKWQGDDLVAGEGRCVNQGQIVPKKFGQFR